MQGRFRGLSGLQGDLRNISMGFKGSYQWASESSRKSQWKLKGSQGWRWQEIGGIIFGARFKDTFGNLRGFEGIAESVRGCSTGFEGITEVFFVASEDLRYVK